MRDPRSEPKAGDIVENGGTYRHVSTATGDGFVTFQQRQGLHWMQSTARVRLAGWRFDVKGWKVVHVEPWTAPVPGLPDAQAGGV